MDKGGGGWSAEQGDKRLTLLLSTKQNIIFLYKHITLFTQDYK